jgi:hypothetical protein
MCGEPFPDPFAFPSLRHNQFTQVSTKAEVMPTDESNNVIGCHIDKSESLGGLKPTIQNVRSPVVLPITRLAFHERSNRWYVVPCCFSYHLHLRRPSEHHCRLWAFPGIRHPVVREAGCHVLCYSQSKPETRWGFFPISGADRNITSQPGTHRMLGHNHTPHSSPALRKALTISSTLDRSFNTDVLAKKSADNLGLILRTSATSARASSSRPIMLYVAANCEWAYM